MRKAQQRNRDFQEIFHQQFENRVIKIGRINSIRIIKSINLLLFCSVLGVRCDADIFKLTAREYNPFMVYLYKRKARLIIG